MICVKMGLLKIEVISDSSDVWKKKLEKEILKKKTSLFMKYETFMGHLYMTWSWQSTGKQLLAAYLGLKSVKE